MNYNMVNVSQETEWSVREGNTLAIREALLVEGLVRPRVCGERAEWCGHRASVWCWRHGHPLLAEEARDQNADHKRGQATEALGGVRRGQPDVEQARRTKPAMDGRCDARAPGILHERCMEARVLGSVEAGSRALPTLHSSSRRSPGHAIPHPSHHPILRSGASCGRAEPRPVVRGVSSVRPFTEKQGT